MKWFSRFLVVDPGRLSSRWIRTQHRSDDRVEFHGPHIAFPVKKILNESPLWNRHKMTKRSAA